MIDRRRLLTSAAALAAGTLIAADDATAQRVVVTLDDHPQLIRVIDDDSAEVLDGNAHQVMKRGDVFNGHTLIEIVSDEGFIVMEDFTTIAGHVLIVDKDGVRHDFARTAEPTAGAAVTFLGHSRDEVMNSARDLLADDILKKAGDPLYDDIAAAFPPIRKVVFDTYSFVGTADTMDKIGFTYGGRTANFDPAVYQPSITDVVQSGAVLTGLAGGYLPVMRFVYPEGGDWTEMLAFAPFRLVDGNPRFQPVWYRVSRVENGKLAWMRHFDSFHPSPPRDQDDPKRFYADLVGLSVGWDRILEPAMTLDVPDRRMNDQARFSLVRAIMTRSAGSPKYGAVDKNYGGSEHDGFPDTFTVETETMLEWGLIERAGQYIDTYFGQFVRDDGTILYRGPETGQFGRMLTVCAHYADNGGDPALLLRHRARIDAVTRNLLALRAEARLRPADDAAHGMISGWCEADSCLEKEPSRYVQPYFSNSTEAERGFRDLGRTWQAIAARNGDAGLAAWGRSLTVEAVALRMDIETAISRSLLTVGGETILPCIAGVTAPEHIAVPRDLFDPQYRGYRAYAEMLHSGNLSAQRIASIADYRAGHHDMLLGVPTAYAYNTGEMAGFLAYGHGYGLIQIDRIREAQLLTYSHMAHQYTRGQWMAPETRKPMSPDETSPYCSPSQCVAPLMTRWLLVFEDPQADILWLGKGMPREWLADNQVTFVDKAPTRWGRIGFALDSRRKTQNRIAARVTFPGDGMAAETRLRLRSHDGAPLRSVTVNGKNWKLFDPAAETVTLPANMAGEVLIDARY